MVSGKIGYNPGCDPAGVETPSSHFYSTCCDPFGVVPVSTWVMTPKGVTAYSPQGVDGDRAFSTPEGSQPVFKSYHPIRSPF
jgi:hypothetical protein